MSDVRDPSTDQQLPEVALEWPDGRPSGSIWLAAHHLVDSGLSFTCVNCGGRTDLTAPCIPGRWAQMEPVVPAAEVGVTSTEPGCTCGGMAACQQCQERDAAEPGGLTEAAHPAPARDGLAERVRALLDEHARSCNPAPYTSERALVERLDALLAEDAATEGGEGS